MPKHILLPLDLHNLETQGEAVGIANKLSDTFGAKISLVTVIPDAGLSMVSAYLPEDFEAQTLERAKSDLESFAKRSFPADKTPKCYLAHGSIYREILEVQEKIGADLIVMASHRPELADYLIGPNAARVVRHAPCSVMVVRG